MSARCLICARSSREDLGTGCRASATSLSIGADDPRIDPLTAFIATPT